MSYLWSARLTTRRSSALNILRFHLRQVRRPATGPLTPSQAATAVRGEPAQGVRQRGDVARVTQSVPRRCLPSYGRFPAGQSTTGMPAAMASPWALPGVPVLAIAKTSPATSATDTGRRDDLLVQVGAARRAPGAGATRAVHAVWPTSRSVRTFGEAGSMP
jgi:hypothetical protein